MINLKDLYLLLKSDIKRSYENILLTLMYKKIISFNTYEIFSIEDYYTIKDVEEIKEIEEISYSDIIKF